MPELILGTLLIVIALLPGAKFYPGLFGRKQKLPPIEPNWIPRLVLLMFGLAGIIDGVSRLRRH
jgi:hypothetical protein